jgi:flagellar biosynthesis protein FliQ
VNDGDTQGHIVAVVKLGLAVVSLMVGLCHMLVVEACADHTVWTMVVMLTITTHHLASQAATIIMGMKLLHLPQVMVTTAVVHHVMTWFVDMDTVTQAVGGLQV